MKYLFITLFIFFYSITSVCAQTDIKIKKPTTCFEFIDLYAKIIEGSEDPTTDDQHRFDLTVERMIGYITGVEMGTRKKIIMPDRGITPNSLLADINRACLVAPNISIDEAILTLPVVTAAIMNANSSSGNSSCDDYCRENYEE